MPSRRDLRIMGAVGVLAVLAVALGTTGVLPAAALYFAPALVLALPLLSGRYVGEEGIVRLAGVLARRVVRAAAQLVARTPRAPRAQVRGGRLIAAALAERGPPPHAA